MTAVLVLLGLALEALLVAAIFAAARNERLRLASLLKAAPDPGALKEALAALPEAEQQIAGRLVEAAQGKGSIDEVLVQAVVVSTTETFAPRLPLRILSAAGLVSMAFAPMIYGALQAAGGIAETAELTRRAHKAAAYVEWQTRLEGPFSALRDACRGTGLLLVGLALLSALAWWLRRPEVREARFVRALLLLASRLRPGQQLPVGARLAELIAPDRGLGRPIVASVLWVASCTLGWMFLQQTAEVRAANGHQPTFDVWPGEQRRPITPGPDLTLPKAPAGAPLDERSRPTLEIGKESVRLQQVPLAELSSGALPDPWEPEFEGQRALLNQYSRPLEVNLLADENATWATVKTVLSRLVTTLEVQRYYLVVDRRVRFGTKEAHLQGALPLQLGHPDRAPALRLVVSPQGVAIGNEPSINFARPEWPLTLRERLRREPGLIEEDRGPLELEILPGSSYRTIVSVLTAADSACLGQSDCGLPGQGFSFVIRP
jgi:hypothetical protein